jgi:hypothetical protein
MSVGGPRDPSAFIPCTGQLFNFGAAAVSTNAAIGALAIAATAAAAPAVAIIAGAAAVTGGLYWMFSGAVDLHTCAQNYLPQLDLH